MTDNSQEQEIPMSGEAPRLGQMQMALLEQAALGQIVAAILVCTDGAKAYIHEADLDANALNTLMVLASKGFAGLQSLIEAREKKNASDSKSAPIDVGEAPPMQ